MVLPSLLLKRETLLLGSVFAVMAFFGLATDAFLSPDNLVTILKNSVDLAVISAGMTLVIIMGGIDVSVGGILAVAAIFIGRAFQWDLPLAAVVLIGPFTGTLLGSFNGYLCTRLRVPPIIATLGTMYIFLGILFIAIGGRWISGLPDTLSPLVDGRYLGVPSVVYIFLVVYGGAWFLLRAQPFGQHLYAMGSNEAAARLAGVAVSRNKILTYALLGALAGFAALLYVARLRNVEVNIGTTLALDAIAATILGGTNIQGGEGSLVGTLCGVLFIKIMQNGLVLLGISSLWESVIIGFLLVTVLTVDRLRRGGLATKFA